jgi:hypothetical protein
MIKLSLPASQLYELGYRSYKRMAIGKGAAFNWRIFKNGEKCGRIVDRDTIRDLQIIEDVATGDNVFRQALQLSALGWRTYGFTRVPSKVYHIPSDLKSNTTYKIMRISYGMRHPQWGSQEIDKKIWKIMKLREHEQAKHL